MEGERGRNINVWLPIVFPPAGDVACNAGMCPDWESNCDPLVHRPTLNPPSYQPGQFLVLSR